MCANSSFDQFMMRYCKRCVIPDTRPNIRLNAEGVCNACESADHKTEIDWTQREQLFRDVVDHAKASSRGYDCLIPVSGGKDSTWQVVKCLEYGLNPLAVTYRPPLRTELGRANLDNLIGLGVDHIDFSVDPNVERKFILAALNRFGNVGIPLHMAIFNISLNVAARFDVPLVIWGENSGFEYGGSEDERSGYRLDSKWLARYGVSHGTTARDWLSPELSEADMLPYAGPGDRVLEEKATKAVFLGYYFPWDPNTTAAVAMAHGMRASETGPRTGYYEFADLDDHLISVHHHLKWYKFGFTRIFDNLSIEIRKGAMTRDQAIEIIRRVGDDTPYEDIAHFCRFVGISEQEFWRRMDELRDPKIWSRREGEWRIDGFLISDWDWK